MEKLITLVARFAKHRTPGGSLTSQVPRSGLLELRRLLVLPGADHRRRLLRRRPKSGTMAFAGAGAREMSIKKMLQPAA